MYYAYEATVKVLFVDTDLNDVETNKCEAYESLEDIPFQDYDYWCISESISSTDIKRRVKEPNPMFLEKSRKNRTKESRESLLTTINKYGILTEA